MLPGCPSAGHCLIELLVRPPGLENQLGLWSAIQIGRPKFVVHVTMFVVRPKFVVHVTMFFSLIDW